MHASIVAIMAGALLVPRILVRLCPSGFLNPLQEQHAGITPLARFLACAIHAKLGDLTYLPFDLVSRTLCIPQLRHMREDIAAIEASNNTLERQARNNNRLLHTLQVGRKRECPAGEGSG